MLMEVSSKIPRVSQAIHSPLLQNLGLDWMDRCCHWPTTRHQTLAASSSTESEKLSKLTGQVSMSTLWSVQKGVFPHIYMQLISVSNICVREVGCFWGFFLTVWGSLCFVDFLFFSHCEFQHRRQILTGRSLLGGEYVLF